MFMQALNRFIGFNLRLRSYYLLFVCFIVCLLDCLFVHAGMSLVSNCCCPMTVDF